MTADTLLSRLTWTKRTGPDRWIARSPTRPDRHPSISIRELPDGRVLLHDHGGDSVQEILDAVGLTFSDLYPPHPQAPGPGKPHRERRPFNPFDILKIMAFEGQLVALAAADLLKGRTPSADDVDRLQLAADRLQGAVEVANG